MFRLWLQLFLKLRNFSNIFCKWLKVGSWQNQVKSRLGGLDLFSYERIIFLSEFLKEDEISPMWATPPNRPNSLPYEQHPIDNESYVNKTEWYTKVNSTIMY